MKGDLRMSGSGYRGQTVSGNIGLIFIDERSTM